MPEGVGAEAVGMGRRLRGERLFEVARFCFVGGMCFLIDYGLLFACTEYGGSIPHGDERSRRRRLPQDSRSVFFS